MSAVVQPCLRRGLDHTSCARTAGDSEVRMFVELTPSGRVSGVRRTG